MDTFSAIADPTRRNILQLLATHGALSVNDISNNFHISQPAISQHLKVLREAKLVDMEKKAQKHVFSMNPEKLEEVETWIQHTTKVWNARFDRLNILLKAEKKGGE